jgi:hypothetical protein
VKASEMRCYCHVQSQDDGCKMTRLKKPATILTMMHNNNGTVGKTSMKTGNLSRNQSLSLTITKVWGMVVVDRMDQQLASYPFMSHYLNR